MKCDYCKIEKKLLIKVMSDDLKSFFQDGSGVLCMVCLHKLDKD